MSKFVAAFRQKAMYQKIGLIALFILAFAVILLCVLYFTRDFGELNYIIQFLLALTFLDETIIFWKENKVLAIMDLVFAVLIMAEVIFFLVI